MKSVTDRLRASHPPFLEQQEGSHQLVVFPLAFDPDLGIQIYLHSLPMFYSIPKCALMQNPSTSQFPLPLVAVVRPPPVIDHAISVCHPTETVDLVISELSFIE